jgi:hypothetical protein
MYEISLLAMFKNESWIIREWIEHYLSEGVEHFYLIDNGSTDDYEIKIQDYMNKISLVKDPTRLPSDTQSTLYIKHFLDIIKNETKWIIVCDIDEYIYSRNGYNTINDVLNTLPNNIEKIWLPWKIFGSNSCIEQPDSIVRGFTKRRNLYDNDLGAGKCISRAQHLINFGCCGHNIQIKQNNIEYLINGEEVKKCKITEDIVQKLDLHLNHYMLMSQKYYLEIKSKRGGGNSGLKDSKYSIEFFKEFDKNYNSFEDLELLHKKNGIYN